MILKMRDEPGGVVFSVFVLPKSSKNMICGLHEESMKIKLTAPPVDGAANKLCIKYLSKCLKVSKSSLEIVSGHTGRNKQILVKCTSGAKDPISDKKKIREKILSLMSKKT